MELSSPMPLQLLSRKIAARILYIISNSKLWKDACLELDKSSDLYRLRSVTATSVADFECFLRKPRVPFHGDKHKESLPSEDTHGIEPREREEFFANLASPEERKGFILIMKRILCFIIPSASPRGTKYSSEFFNLFVSEEYRLSIKDAMNSQDWEKVESLVMPLAAASLGRAILYHAFVISAVFHLSVVYQYLVGHIDGSGGKAHSSGSLEFRNVYISIVLFLGAYIWIKSRDDVASPSQQTPSTGIHRKSRVTASGVTEYRFEPRFKPSHGANYISVGSYEDEEDARTMYQILGFLYGKNVPGELPLPDGSNFPIPPMTEEEQRLNPEEKRGWAKAKAMEFFNDYKLRVGNCWMEMFRGPASDQFQATRLVDCPDANAASGGVQAAEAYLTFQGDHQGNIPVSLSSLSPNIGLVTAGVQDHVANHPLSSHIVGRDASQCVRQPRLPGEQHLEPQLQQGSLPANNLAINVILDDHSPRRLVKDLQQQIERQQLEIQLLEGEAKILRSTNHEQASQISQLNRQQQVQQLRIRHLESNISDLEFEVDGLRSKRARIDPTPRSHDSQH